MLCEMFILYNTKFDSSHIKNTGGRQLRNGHLNELVKLESKDIVLRWVECGDSGIMGHSWQDWRIGTAVFYQYLSKYAKVDLALDLAIPFLGNNKVIFRDSYKDDCPQILLTL